MNEDLITSAVSFLKDPNVASSPVNKRIEFLETKGLNQQEIEEALKRASGASGTSSSSGSSTVSTQSSPSYSSYSVPSNPPLDYYAPQVPDRSWKDYFIMATATAGVSYGLYQVVTRYLIPTIIPPTQLRIDDDKEKIDEEFIKIDKVLEQMAIEQKEIKDANEAKLKDIDVVIDNVNDFLSKYNKDKLKFDDDLRLMKLEVDNLKNSIEKNMSLTKENIHDELSDISEELASLKNLIKARGENASSDSVRKVAPVSSIPSASEILKKAKAKTAEAKPVEAKPAEEKPVETKTVVSPPASGSSWPAPEKTNEPVARSPGEQKGDIFAAGIPDWQLKHKQQEEQNESQAPKPDEVAAWQQLFSASKEVVEKSIEAVGVPAWQLNAK